MVGCSTWSSYPHCSRWEEVWWGSSLEEAFSIQGGLWSFVSFSLVLAGLLSYQGPFHFPVSCNGATPSLDGGVAEGITWLGSPVSSLQPNV